MDSRRTDWLIVGGGPAGALAARELSRAGKEVYFLQRNPDFRKPCGGGLRMDAFGRFGLDHDSILHTVDRFELCHRETKIPLDISASPLAIVDRLDFDRSLRKEAIAAGAGMITASFKSLRKRGEGFEVICRGPEGEKRILTRHLIAADGVLSPVRRVLTGSPPPSILTRYTESEIREDDGSTGRFRFGKAVAGRLYAWDFPGPHGRHLGTLAGPGNLERFLRHTRLPAGKIRGYRIPRYTDPLFEKEGVFFVGDAAGQVLPFTYEGIYYALASAELLVHTRLETDDSGSYAAAWGERFGKKFDTLKRLERLFLSTEPGIAVMMRLFRNPSVQRGMIELWLKENRPLPDGAALYLKILRRLVS